MIPWSMRSFWLWNFVLNTQHIMNIFVMNDSTVRDIDDIDNFYVDFVVARLGGADTGRNLPLDGHNIWPAVSTGGSYIQGHIYRVIYIGSYIISGQFSDFGFLVNSL